MASGGHSPAVKPTGGEPQARQSKGGIYTKGEESGPRPHEREARFSLMILPQVHLRN